MKKSSLLLLILLSALGGFSQDGKTKADRSNSWALEPMNLHWLDRIDNSEKYFEWSDEIWYHTSVLPMIPHHTWKYKGGSEPVFFKPSPLQLTNRTTVTPPKYAFRLYPLFDMEAGIDIDSSGTRPLYTLGLGAAAEFKSKRWYLSAKLLPYTTDAPYVADSIQRNHGMDAGTTRPIIDQLYQRSEFTALFRPNRFFTLMGGYGKHFFGEGYRSLLLSDNASAYPYARMETSFGSIKYVNQYNIWNDNSVDPANKSQDRMKFSAMHCISWDVVRWFNISIFESVVWQYQDSLVNRGFDLHYLNPVIFYRPVEYGQGSADNVILGANTSFKMHRGHVLYAQFVLYEFLLSELRARSRWWGNKYGLQLGYKTNALLDSQLYVQAEFNVVRPFTFSHKTSTLSYGHLNASVTHPLGANFWEVLNIVSFQRKGDREKKLRFTNKLTWASFGVDSNATSFGQDIFKPYSFRPDDFNQKIMQGLRYNVMNEHFIVEYPIVKGIGLYANLTYNYRMAWTKYATAHEHYLLLGIRTRLWNKYTDY